MRLYFHLFCTYQSVLSLLHTMNRFACHCSHLYSSLQQQDPMWRRGKLIWLVGNDQKWSYFAIYQNYSSKKNVYIGIHFGKISLKGKFYWKLLIIFWINPLNTVLFWQFIYMASNPSQYQMVEEDTWRFRIIVSFVYFY